MTEKKFWRGAADKNAFEPINLSLAWPKVTSLEREVEYGNNIEEEDYHGGEIVPSIWLHNDSCQKYASTFLKWTETNMVTAFKQSVFLCAMKKSNKKRKGNSIIDERGGLGEEIVCWTK